MNAEQWQLNIRARFQLFFHLPSQDVALEAKKMRPAATGYNTPLTFCWPNLTRVSQQKVKVSPHSQTSSVMSCPCSSTNFTRTVPAISPELDNASLQKRCENVFKLKSLPFESYCKWCGFQVSGMYFSKKQTNTKRIGSQKVPIFMRIGFPLSCQRLVHQSK